MMLVKLILLEYIIVHTTSNYIVLSVGMYTTFHIVTLHIIYCKNKC